MMSRKGEDDPRKRLDREQVLAGAETLVDRDGWEQLTMSALAGELGVKASSLYNHVESLEALRGELQNRTLRSLGASLNRKAMGRTRETAMRALADTFRRFANEHPGRYDLAMRAPFDRGGFDEAAAEAGAAMAAVIRSYGIDAPFLEFQLAAFSALHGVLALEHAGFFPPGIDTEHIYGMVLDLVLALFDGASKDEEQAS